MATKHASSGEVIDLRPLGAPLDGSRSTTLLRDERPEVMPPMISSCRPRPHMTLHRSNRVSFLH
jgi:hypothetical protein